MRIILNSLMFPSSELWWVVTEFQGQGNQHWSMISSTPRFQESFHNSTKKVGEHKEITGLDQIDKVVAIDQKPIGRHRSNPVTYIKVFDEIRDFFANSWITCEGLQTRPFLFQCKRWKV